MPPSRTRRVVPGAREVDEAAAGPLVDRGARRELAHTPPATVDAGAAVPPPSAVADVGGLPLPPSGSPVSTCPADAVYAEDAGKADDAVHTTDLVGGHA